ncbi:uncharacterized protein TRIVIDRAFT_54187 [Trichoderma virens Gv29-8]|uniref:Uncharacterized protein n=1 Tax=Hypocrea virens (strain Gv29-8 / FGSC 10586) TaxID=413071 RepID=G9MTK9_HYPVG|nr:uncharacterized protein TRIVIDRAFT_54187 [Trichoderma virens Gv29-8]EHK22360.1 hypothetical protein TRIVIDRAFT_54187 [Trichoderma virens Gv29-8]
MESIENRPSTCFEPSTSRERIFVKDKPSPLRIIKRSRKHTVYDENTPKGSCTAAYVDVSPTGSPPGALLRSVDGTLRIPRRRPKTVSEEKHGNDAATGAGRSSQRSSLDHRSVSRVEIDDITEQDSTHRIPSFFRYPTAKMKAFRRKRHSVISNLEDGDGDGNLSTCILTNECSGRRNSSSRASSRCTNYDPKGAYCSIDSSVLSTPSLREKSTYVLSPYIRVVSQTAGISTGQQHIWAAVEVSGRLFSPSDGPELEPQMTPYSDQDAHSRFGCLYNLTVDILPKPKSSLLQTTCLQQFPTTMFVGSSILLLVHVMCQSRTAFSSSSSSRQQKHIRQRSDELIEDLQLQLGDSLMTYMSIHVSYSHSAFPSKPASAGSVEISSLHTKLSTTAEATIKLHNELSPWSPHPILVKDRLLPLIKSHWGPRKASEAMQQMLKKRSTLTSEHTKALTEELDQDITQELPHHRYSPAIDPRQTSIQGTRQMNVKSRPSSHPLPVARVSYDWEAGMRGVSDGKVAGTGKSGKSGKGRKEGKEASLGDRWSATPGVLGSPTYNLASDMYGDRDEDGEDDKRNKGKDQKHGAAGDDGGKKNAGLWTWATWF